MTIDSPFGMWPAYSEPIHLDKIVICGNCMLRMKDLGEGKFRCPSCDSTN